MANLASPIPMMDPNTNNDSGYAPSNIDGETKEHSPPPSPLKEESNEEKKEENSTVSEKNCTNTEKNCTSEPAKKPELK